MKGAGMLVVSLKGVNFGFLVSLKVFGVKCQSCRLLSSRLFLYTKKY